MSKPKVKASRREPAGAKAPVKPATPPASGWRIFLGGLALVLAGLAAYSDSFRGPFIFDDQAAVRNNPTIQHGWVEALHPPTDGATTMGRPLLNLSFALNYGSGGLSVEGYHVANLAIHLLAGLVLFGLVRRTLAGPILRDKFGAAALPIAWVATLLWLLHPLQTESVTYVAQRAESMMALFYLLTLYGFVRGAELVGSWPWYGLSVTACLLGVFSKEVIVSAPLMVLLHDRTFFAGTFAEAWRRRQKLYIALGATWLVLAAVVMNAGSRDQSAGFGTGVSMIAYALSQFPAITQYLWLSFWPHPLAFDYGQGLASTAAEIIPGALLVLALTGGTLYALWRRPALGYVGFWFFAILAPSSSVVPIITETAAEHRMYLPLAALTVLVAVGFRIIFGARALVASCALAVALGILTFQRNEDYQSLSRIWGDTTAKHPEVARAHENEGIALYAMGRLPESAQEYATALQMKPTDADFENNLGNALARLGQPAQALPHFTVASQKLRRVADQAVAYYNMGNALHELDRWDDAIQAYQQAVRLNPAFAEAHNNLGLCLMHEGQFSEAAPEFAEALRIKPDFDSARASLAEAQQKQARPPGPTSTP